MSVIIKRVPEIGDAMIDTPNGYRFVGSDATSGFFGDNPIAGVVFYVRGRNGLLTPGDIGTYKWSDVADFEITKIPDASGTLAVTLQGVAVGDFEYTRTEGTLEEFVLQLNTWLATNAAKWEAYMYNGKAYLQLSDYTAYSSTNTITGCTLVKLVGSELANETVPSASNHVRQFTTCNGICRQRLEEWAKNNTDKNCNPTTRMNGTTQLFQTYPASQTYFDGELGDGLRENFATYQDYMDACMLLPFELNRGIMQYRDGKKNTERLIAKRLLKRGEEICPYTAALKAAEYDSGVEGYRAGDFWLSSIHELSLMMRDITTGTSKGNDIVNAQLARAGKNTISSTSLRWSSSRYYTVSAWSAHGNGFSSSYNFFSGLRVAPVSAFRF